ncbi:MAG: amidohydrolase family protein [Betaproteobacteria bacterium]
MKAGLFLLGVTTFGVAAAGIVVDRSAAPSRRRPAQGATAVVNARVFDGERVLDRATVVFAHGRITAIGADAATPPGATVVDGAGRTLLPGLIDSHTHAFGDALARALVFGVTTELDMFTSPEFSKAMHTAQAEGDVTDRADLRSAGILVTAPHGHGTEYFPIPTLGSAAEAQAFVDARLAEGSDYIKIIVDDGSSYGTTIPTLTSDEVAAVVRASHARGRMAVVHIGSQREAIMAIESGADGLAHLFADSPPSDRFAPLVAAHHAFVIPTLTVLESTTGRPSGASLTTDHRLAPYLDEAEIAQLKTVFPHRPGSKQNLEYARAAVAQLKAAGVPLLAGSDAPNPGTAHGASIHRELELLVSAGLTPAEALAAASSVPARVFGLTDRGRIAVGLRADLVLVDGDPTRDITATRAIAGVWRNGARVARTPATHRPSTAVASPRPARGVISDFDGGAADAAFGAGWMVSTDQIRGGHSTATMTVAPNGAEGSAGCLTVAGSIRGGTPYPWAGAMFSPGPKPMAPADLSKHKELVFWARGDGGTYGVLVFAARFGMIPAEQRFAATSEWREHAVPLSAFGGDGTDITAILITAGAGQDAFRFQIDGVRLR